MRSASREKILTREDRQRFAFLFDPLRNDPVRAEFLSACLLRCKAANVPLDQLSHCLRSDLAVASNPHTLVALKAMKSSVEEGVKRFKQARRLLTSMPIALGSRTGKANAEALLAIMEAVDGELPRVQELARQMLAARLAVERRRGARTTGRKRLERNDYASLGVHRDDARQLWQTVRHVAQLAPIRYNAGIILTRVPDDRCAVCGNPAARLFRPAT